MSVTTGDFDGDGNVDLAVANSGSNNVSVLLGNGDGTFQVGTDYAVGSDPVSIAAGQFDGDGFLDLSVANRGSTTLTNLMSLGNGTFLVDETTSVTSDPVSIATGDFNHDGLTDQAIALADPDLDIDLSMLRGAFFPKILAASSNGAEIAGAGKNEAGKQFVVVWDATNGRRISIKEETRTITGLAFSSDGNNLAVGTWDGIHGYVTIYSLKTGQIVNTIPVGPPATKTLRAATRKPTSVVFSPGDSSLAVTDSNGDIEVWQNPLQPNVTELAILHTPATGSGVPLVAPSTVFFSDGWVAGGYSNGYAVYSLFPTPPTSQGVGKIPLNQSPQLQATAYTGTYDVNGVGAITTHYVVVGFNTGVVEVDEVGGGNSVVKSTLQLNHNTPVVALAFPNNKQFAKADARGLTLGDFDPTTGTMTATTGVSAPDDTTLIAMASSSTVTSLEDKKTPIYVAVFADGNIIEFNQANGDSVRTIKNSTE
jgi:WD40 repeat protein